MPKDNFLVQAYTLLSQRLSNIDKDYIASACIHQEEAEIIGYCKAWPLMFEKSDFSKWLEQKAIPALQKIGMARWPRSELTNLGLRIGSRDELSQSLGVKDASTNK